MTIPKRDKRRKREIKAPASPPAHKMVVEPDIKKSNAPRTCLACGRDSFSTICRCGRLTVFKNKIR